MKKAMKKPSVATKAMKTAMKLLKPQTSYGLRSATWVLTFSNQDKAARAASSMRQLNDTLHFLAQGSAVRVDNASVHIVWRSVIRGHSLVDYLYANCRGTFGPCGKFSSWSFSGPASASTHAPEAAPATEAAGASTKATEAAGAPTHVPGTYIDLPGRYALDASQWYVPGKAMALLQQNGFVVLRGFLPEYLCQPARQDIEAHFLTILGSFTGGHAVDCIDKVHLLDGKVWERIGGISYSPFAEKQGWGCSTTRGYQQKLGLGKALSAAVFRSFPSVMACQHYMRHYLAFLHCCSPEALCWQPEGGSVKGRGQGRAPPHRDNTDYGRYQCVLSLADGAFDIWPGSHKVLLKADEHFHLSASNLETVRAQSTRLACRCSPGDVLVFEGGTFVHGSPAVWAGDPSPRIMTYAKFWPPGTSQGADHAAGRCGCQLPYES